MDRLVSPAAIPQRVQCCEQSEIDTVAIVPSEVAEASHEIIDPVVRRAEGGVEFSDWCHSPAFHKLSGDQSTPNMLPG
jgi:hypothetical protein